MSETNPYSQSYLPNTDFDDLSSSQRDDLANVAYDFLTGLIESGYEEWGFGSEEMPYLIDQAVKIGIIRERKHHIETIEKVVYDE